MKDKTKKASDLSNNVFNSPSPVSATSSPSTPSSIPNAADFFGSLGLPRTPTNNNNNNNAGSNPGTPLKASAVPNLNSKLPGSPNFTSNDDISKFFNDLLAKKK